MADDAEIVGAIENLSLFRRKCHLKEKFSDDGLHIMEDTRWTTQTWRRLITIFNSPSNKRELKRQFNVISFHLMHGDLLPNGFHGNLTTWDLYIRSLSTLDTLQMYA